MLDSPAARRNRGPILEVLQPRLDARASVLEIASGSGQHAAFFAAAMPGVRWQPSDLDASLFDSIVERVAEAGLANVLAPVVLDVTDADWGVGAFDAVFNANMIHISPWETCAGLFRGAGRHLRPGGQVFLYGPFKEGGAHTAPSNAAFDADLRRRDPRWGVRDVEAVEDVARQHGLAPREALPMPANNRLLVFGLSRAAGPARAPR